MAVIGSGTTTQNVGLGRFVFRGRRRAAGRRPTSGRLVALFVLPALAIYLLFMVWPFIGTVYYSMTSWDGYAPTKDFVGLTNYLVLLNDAAFWEALSHNLVWVVVGTAAPILIGLPLSIILWSGAHFRTGFRAIFFLPVILPTVVIGIVWSWIYNPLFGPLNVALESVGLEEIARGWLGDPGTALIAVLIAAIWATFGLVTVMFLAGLQGIDMNLIDAARVDGANAWQRTRHVLLPGIAPILTFVLTITLVGGFSVFDIVYVMTLGGPGTATEVMAGYAYKMAFSRNYAGYGAAVAMVIAVMSLVMAIVLLRFRERTRA